MNQFCGADGWPCEFKDSPIGTELLACVESLSGADRLPRARKLFLAELLLYAGETGENDKLPRNKPASTKQSVSELRKTEKQIQTLIGTLEAIHGPVVHALFEEGANPFELIERLRGFNEIVGHAGSEIIGNKDSLNSVFGNNYKPGAKAVTLQAKATFEEVTGQKPSIITRHVADGPRTYYLAEGPFIEFCERVFKALAIDASAEAQARRVLRRNDS